MERALILLLLITAVAFGLSARNTDNEEDIFSDCSIAVICFGLAIWMIMR